MASLEDVGKSPGGDSMVGFLRVSHNDDGTLKVGVSSGTLAQVLANGHDAGASQINNLADPTSPQDAATKHYVDSSGGGGSGGLGLLTWNVVGTLTAQTGVSQIPIPATATISSVTIRAATAPTGASIIVDVNKNGTTIFTTQANRPTITATGNVSGQAVPDVTALAVGDYLTVDIDQVGSTIAGSDLVVVLRFA